MATAASTGLFLGVAVAEYDDSWVELGEAMKGVSGLEQLLASHGYATQLVPNPTREKLLEELEALTAMRGQGFEGPLVLVWSGHGEALGGALALILKDTPTAEPGKRLQAYPAGQLVSLLQEAGSKDSAVIIDTCSAGAADRDLFLEHLRRLEETTWKGQGPRLACVVSCKAYEKAADGAFIGQLVELLRDGPGDLDLGAHALLWGSSSNAVPLQSVFYAIDKRSGEDDTHPRTWASGSSDISFPNPRYDPKAGAALVDDRIREVRGEPLRPSSLLETPASEELAAGVERGEAELWLLTGGAGAGKSSCLQLVRESLGDRIVVHPARLGVDGLATRIAAAPKEAAIAIDALDEAPARERAEIVELATGWSHGRFVVIATRAESGADDATRALAKRLAERARKVIDLDQARWQGDAIHRYVIERLREFDDEA